MCEPSLASHPFHSFCCKYGGARNRPHRTVQCTLRRLIGQAGGYADLERHVPELYDWVTDKDGVTPVMRCAILDVVCWFPGVLQLLWIDVSVRCPHAERYYDSASKSWELLQRQGKQKKQGDMATMCDRWSSRLMEDWVVKASSCCVTW